MKRFVCYIAVLFFVLSSIALTPVQPSQIGTASVINYFKKESQLFANSTVQLQQTLAAIRPGIPATVQQAKQQLSECRSRYKRIEFFVEYFFENRIRIFNPAPVYEIEEPHMEYQSPVGMQVIEELLFDDNVASHKRELAAQAEVVATTAKGLSGFLYRKQVRDEEILESMRLELVRIITIGITGYDAQHLKTGIEEAHQSMLALQENLQPYLRAAPGPAADAVSGCLQRTVSLLSAAKDFDSFNRLSFLSQAALPLQERLGLLINQLGLNLQTTPALNYEAPHIFSPDALNKKRFAAGKHPDDPSLIILGERLFSEPLLSGNGRRSCATCHVPEKYFTDGLAKSLAFDEQHPVKRNAPSLLYAAYQHGLFLDGRSATLEAQLQSVLRSASEMSADEAEVGRRLSTHALYRQLFKGAFPSAEADSLFSFSTIATAIAAYERSLPVMRSAFDRYMQGDRAALGKQQVKGFNLFMGKALCGTCHFAPLFNGLLPPLYNRTELESLGVPGSAGLRKPLPDTDSGRYHVFPIRFYMGVFKTPTVRNTARTAPYMHNGALHTLKEVMDFYNKGGGNGLGLHNAPQTLSAQPLHLSKAESRSIISFLQALTDEPVRQSVFEQ